MVTSGNATVIVSNMAVAVQFYTEVLGLKLTNRFGDHWATVEAGPGLIIGLHPASPQYPAPGTKGAMMLGLEIDGSIEDAIGRLAERGVHVSMPPVRTEVGAFVSLEDPDGNAIYLWEVNRDLLPQSELQPAAGEAR
jgi:predicted enzyme related to lactoylglutathione lyase